MRVLIACEFSGIVRDAFIARGHDAISCDLLPTESELPGKHYQCDVETILHYQPVPDLMIAFPPCTYLARSGWRWVNAPDSNIPPLKGEPRRQAAFEAAAFFRRLFEAPILRIAIENPRPIVHVGLPAPTQVIQPWQFGHDETKATCLWLKNLPPLMSTIISTGRIARVHKEPPSPERSKNRSRTYQGIADAMAEQWGGLL